MSQRESWVRWMPTSGVIVPCREIHARHLVTGDRAVRHVGAEGPHRRVEQRRVDDRPLAGTQRVHEGCADPAGEEHPRRHVTLRRPLPDELGRAGLGEHVAHPAARPERHRVEAAGFGVGAALALAVALGEHQLRVQGEEVGGLGAELAPDAGELIRDVHVGPLHEPLEHGAARGLSSRRARSRACSGWPSRRGSRCRRRRATSRCG